MNNHITFCPYFHRLRDAANKYMDGLEDFEIKYDEVSESDRTFKFIDYNEFTIDLFKYQDVINACTNFYGTAQYGDSYALSLFYHDKLYRFMDIGTNKELSNSTVSTIFLPNVPILMQHLLAYKLYFQYLDLNKIGKLAELLSLQQEDAQIIYEIISKQRYGISTKLKIIKTFEEITEINELFAYYNGLYITSTNLIISHENVILNYKI